MNVPKIILRSRSYLAGETDRETTDPAEGKRGGDGDPEIGADDLRHRQQADGPRHYRQRAVVDEPLALVAPQGR